MSIQELDVWCENIVIDVTNTPQRRDLEPEEYENGWLRLDNVTFQQINQLFYLLTNYANPWTNSPVLFPTTLPIPSNALEMNGQAITQEASPNAFEAYGGTLPDLTIEAPAGFTYIIRNS